MSSIVPARDLAFWEGMGAIEQDTIVAVATAPGRGGIGVVRVSGPGARVALAGALGEVGEVRRAEYRRVVDPETGMGVDEAVVTFFAGPHSYTGEDVVEVAAHGSPVVLDFLLRQAVAGGARMARAGEFTQRAFLNGRMDLTQAEAVRDLIQASTMEQARLAAEQLGGALARRVGPVKEALVGLIAGLEAGIDFAEDDIDVMGDGEILRRLGEISGKLEGLERSFAYGRVVRDGLTLAIVGPPNAGKSSLFNRLLDRERAIVTATPGTTRDVVAERVAIGGIPVELLDTAGLRATTDEAEAMGIARTREAMATADVVLLVTEASHGLGGEERELLGSLAARAFLQVRNKVDLMVTKGREDGLIYTSALTGEGIEALREAIAVMVREGNVGTGGMLTNRRQHGAVVRALGALGEAREAVAGQVPHEMLTMHFHAGLEALDELTGTTTAEDVLGVIFSSFCIGK